MWSLQCTTLQQHKHGAGHTEQFVPITNLVINQWELTSYLATGPNKTAKAGASSRPINVPGSFRPEVFDMSFTFPLTLTAFYQK